MKHPLTYIEQQLKLIQAEFPDYYDHILESKELSDFIFFLIENYSDKADLTTVYRDSEKLISGDFFRQHSKEMIFNKLNAGNYNEYRNTFEKQTEEAFLTTNYDISASRQIRYMPAQWHYTSYFQIYHVHDGDCPIYFHSNEKLILKKGDILILAPYVDHATPCYTDDSYLEYFLLRSSNFDKVFWQQLNSSTIMSHFFRNALKNEDNSKVSYLLFHTESDEDILELIRQINLEITKEERYSSQLINGLMSVMFCLLLRRYEDSVILPTIDNVKWKAEFTRIFSYIQNNYTTTSLEDVAQQCSYSTKQVGRIIKQYFNMSYTELITFLKMDKAVAMLKESAMSMEDIAISLGYSDLSSFYRAFKKYYRETPVNYLKNE